MRCFRRSATTVIQVRRLIAALEDVQHAADGGLVGANELAVALIGGTAVSQQLFQFACLFEDVRAAWGCGAEGFETTAIGTQLPCSKGLAAEGGMLTEKCQQALFLDRKSVV